MQTNKSNGQLTAQINLSDQKKSGFDLSNNVLGTGKIGRIIPTRALHVMPNDTIKQDSKVAVQFEPLAVPILANMDVRQEHFYVPYNIVWKNWDKFISGGEKMDYQGVVPNVSMKTIVQSLDTIISSTSADGKPVLPIKTSNAGASYQLDTEQFSYMLTNTKDALDYTGDKYQIKDLFKPQYESIEILHNILYDNDDLFVLNASGTADDLKEYIRVNLGANKYMTAIQSLLIAKEYYTVFPTEKFIEYAQAMYEWYKPLVGIGSNIDYLNMGRVTFTDFLYAMLANAIPSILSQVSTTNVTVAYEAFNQLPLSVLNLRANYNIWFNNYRDILLEADAYEPISDDEVTLEELFILLIPRQRCWEKDAFTTALDNPGTGNVGVITNGSYSAADGYVSVSNPYEIIKLNNVDSNASNLIAHTEMVGNNIAEVRIGESSWSLPTAFLSGIQGFVHNNGDSVADQVGFSLYALDAAQRAQKWLQKALFYGNRISDFYYMHFGVRFLDARLRLPELLTSSRELVKLDVVMNNTNITTEAGGEIFQSVAGDRSAYASAYDNGNSFDRFCEEHGVIMSYLTIMPQVTYAYGINRDYSRLDQFDFAFSEFATLGMDAVYDTEITANCLSANITGNSDAPAVFGYQGKYYDYKSKHSEEHGELLDSQDMYTFARKFNMYDAEGRPKLNYEFVHCFPDLDMFVVNSTTQDYFRYDIRHSTAAERVLPSQSLYI